MKNDYETTMKDLEKLVFHYILKAAFTFEVNCSDVANRLIDAISKRDDEFKFWDDFNAWEKSNYMGG